MNILLLISQIIVALPNIFKAVKEILKLVEDLHGEDKITIKADFNSAVEKAKTQRKLGETITLAEDLEGLLKRLREHHGKNQSA